MDETTKLQVLIENGKVGETQEKCAVLELEKNAGQGKCSAVCEGCDGADGGGDGDDRGDDADATEPTKKVMATTGDLTEATVRTTI